MPRENVVTIETTKITWGLVAFIFVVSIVTTFSLGNKAQNVDYTEKIEALEAAPEFPAAIPSAEVPAEEE